MGDNPKGKNNVDQTDERLPGEERVLKQHMLNPRPASLTMKIKSMLNEACSDPWFRNIYSVFTALLIIIWGACPLVETGFLQTSWNRVMYMICLWAVTTITEKLKTKICKIVDVGDFSLSHPSYKTSSLLFLPYSMWSIFIFLNIWNIGLFLRYRRTQTVRSVLFPGFF